LLESQKKVKVEKSKKISKEERETKIYR